MEISFNYEQITGKFDDFFLTAGYDEIRGTYSPFGRASLEKIRELNTGIKYIRIHNMFTGAQGDLRGEVDAGCDPVTRKKDGTLEFDFSRLNKVYEVLINNGYIPYVEFGFMPEELSSASKDKKNRWKYPPKDYEEWKLLIVKTLENFRNQFPDHVDKFIYEVWNEPDVGYFTGSVKDYCKLYDYTVDTLNLVFPDGNFHIGAPAQALSRVGFMKKFLKHCLYGKNYANGEIGTRIDFVSFHLKGGFYFQTPNIKKIVKKFHRHMKNIRKFQRGGKYAKRYDNRAFLPKDIEIHITEMDPIVGCAKGIEDKSKLKWRNTEYYSAFIGYIAILFHYIREANNYNIRWMFSDFFHFSDEAAKGRIFAGCRSPTTGPFQGKDLNENLNETRVITNPVLKGFQILNKMKGSVLYNNNPISIPKGKPINALCIRTRNAINLLVSHFDPSLKKCKNREISVKISNIPPKFEISGANLYTVDEDYNNTYKIWKDLGGPLDPKEKELKQIQNQEKLLITRILDLVIDEGLITINLDLTPHSLNYIEIKLKE